MFPYRLPALACLLIGAALSAGLPGAAFLPLAGTARGLLLGGVYLLLLEAFGGFSGLRNVAASGWRRGFLSLPEAYGVAAFAGGAALLAGRARGGVVLPAAEAWFSSGFLFLGVAPAALALLCRALPLRAGTALPEEGAARLGLGSLLLCGGWAGAASAVPGPVPAWIGSAGIAATLLLVLAAVAWLVVVGTLLRDGGGKRIAASAGGPFLLTAACAFPLWIFLFWLAAFRGVGALLHGTLFDAALADLPLAGVGIMAPLGFFAGAGRAARAAFPLCAGGLFFLIGGEIAGGTLQALFLSDAELPFRALGSLLAPFLWMRSIGWGLLAVGLGAHLLGSRKREEA